ncbi:MAG: hypothetical protein LWW85_03330 [Marinilabiliales bacterium]|nr:hypothetical protein [Marinilabiliales bacterium]
MNGRYLLPQALRIAGLVLLVIGSVLLLLRFQFNWKPDFLEWKVFAFYAFYISAKSFTIIQHQMIEEIAGVLITAGLGMIAFSREKKEDALTSESRLKAFLFLSYFNLVYLIIALLTFFGFGYVAALICFTAVWLLVYILLFRYFLSKARRSVPPLD